VPNGLPGLAQVATPALSIGRRAVILAEALVAQVGASAPVAGALMSWAKGKSWLRVPTYAAENAQIRSDLVLNGEIELIAIGPLEIFREAEEWAARCKELRRNERKRISTGDADTRTGRGTSQWDRAADPSRFRHQFIVRTG